MLLPLLWMLPCGASHAQCNGDTSLCNRRFDEVCYLYTHNSYNVRGDHRLPNQNLSVTDQLALGVRGMMLDVYQHGDRVMVYHAHRLLGHRPLQEDLLAIKAFLDAHPREVFSIIFESHVAADALAQALADAGLLPYLHAQPQAAPWPTLGEMVAAGRRLVVFSEKDQGNPYPWLHHAWDYLTENHYANHALADFSTTYNRGDTTQRLYLLNHFITHRKLGYGLRDSAAVANDAGVILDRALRLQAVQGRFPNFVAVDFVESGTPKAAVDLLNRERLGLMGALHTQLRAVDWTPATQTLTVSLHARQHDGLVLQLRSRATGELLMSAPAGPELNFVHVLGRDLPAGHYFLEAIGPSTLEHLPLEMR